MKIDAVRFGLASALTAGLLWIACSALVAVMPGAMMALTGDMFHIDPIGSGWALTLRGVAIGLLAWAAFAFAWAWLLGTIYNRMLR